MRIKIKEGLYTEEEKEIILEKARNIEYKHARFYLEGGKTVEEAIGYFANSDFYLDLVNNYKSGPNSVIGLDEYLRENNLSTHMISRRDVIHFCINTKQWKPLVIRYMGKERGTDRGKLKVETFLIKRGLV